MSDDDFKRPGEPSLSPSSTGSSGRRRRSMPVRDHPMNDSLSALSLDDEEEEDVDIEDTSGGRDDDGDGTRGTE